MGLQSSLTTALTGLTAAETQISVIGNNLANSNTVGFKASQAEFATQFLQTLSLGGAPTENEGGTNPRQIGLGTMIAQISPNFSQGTIEISANATDLAIQGEGFFIVEGAGGEHLYTRNGIFKMNADNELVTLTGNRLLGFGVDDRYQIQATELQSLQIPLGAREVALATENVYVQGSLTPTGDVADTAEILETDILGDGAYTAPSEGTTATAIAAPGEDDTISGEYSYYITFADAAGGPGNGTESRPSPLIGPLSVVNGRVQLQDLPVDTSGQWSVRRIYRSLATDSNTFYYVGEINDATTAGLTFTDNAADATIALNDQLDFDGPRILVNTPLVQVLRRDGDYYENVFEEGTLEFTATKGGRSLATKELEITSTTNVLDLLEFMEQAMGIQEPPGPDHLNPIPADSSGANPGGSVTTEGRLRLVANNGVYNAIDIGLSGLQLETASGRENVNLPFQSVQSAIGESAATDFIVYDSLGIPLNVRLTAVLESRDSTVTTYRWFADCQDNDPASGVEIAVGTGLISFDGEGRFVQATETSVSVERRNISSTTPLVFDLDFTELSGLASDSSNLAISRQDGFPPGVLTDFVVGEDGLIRGIFSNGIAQDLGQIRMARFSNPAGLEQQGENLFVTGVNSGQPVQGNPGELGIGDIISGAVELSNTDIGGNLIDLIVASTMYRGNTRVITTAQEMMDELLALRR